MPSLSLIVSCPTRLPSALTAVAMRVPSFTVAHPSKSSWLIFIPQASHNVAVDLMEALPTHTFEVDKYVEVAA